MRYELSLAALIFGAERLGIGYHGPLCAEVWDSQRSLMIQSESSAHCRHDFHDDVTGLELLHLRSPEAVWGTIPDDAEPKTFRQILQ